MSQPPPPRYRIVERDGRLVTIDTWAKDVPKASVPPPSMTPTPKVDPWRTARPTSPLVPAASNAEMLVAAMLRKRDDQGRRLLRTIAAWDRKGPRTIALSPVGERRLGRVMLVALVLGFAAILLAISDFDWLLPIAIIFAALLTGASKAGVPLITRFLDSLGDDRR